MNIIEKLGIRSVSAHPVHKDGYTFFSFQEVRELEQQRNEMLEALIEVRENDYLTEGAKWFYEGIIKRATGKTWEEIKELLNE